MKNHSERFALDLNCSSLKSEMLTFEPHFLVEVGPLRNKGNENGLQEIVDEYVPAIVIWSPNFILDYDCVDISLSTAAPRANVLATSSIFMFTRRAL